MNVVSTLTVNSINLAGTITISGVLVIPNDVWVYSKGDGYQQIYFAINGTTYFQGYNSNGTNNHEWRNSGGSTIMGLNEVGSLYVLNQITCRFYTITNSGTDYIGVSANNANGAFGNYTLYIMYGTFTGFHRVFTEDEKYDKEDPQKFEDDYAGRIVVSIGKIATDTNNNDPNTESQINYDKEGITIEDALPMIELSRTKKDKRVFGF